VLGVFGLWGGGCLSLKSCPIYNEDDHLGENKSGAVLLNT